MRKVSVIVPCYNYGHLLAETLDSILRQTDRNWECIIVDDGSTDNTRDVALGFAERDERFEYVYQENKGLSAARNTGIRNATGEFLQFLDADDLIDEKKLELQAQFLLEHPNIDIVFGETRYFFTDDPERLYHSIDGKKRPLAKKIFGTGNDIVARLLVDNIMAVSSPLLRRKVVETAGYFDESLRALEDWEYWLRCAVRGVCFHYHHAVGTFTLIRVHPNSMSRNKQTMLDANLTIRKQLQSILEDKNLLFLNERGIVNAENAMAVNAIRNGSIIAGSISLLRNAIKTLKFRLA